jgi:hypothetical protein
MHTSMSQKTTTDVIIKMFLDKNPQLLPLLMYIKEHENDEKGISRQKVVNYMNEENLSSKVTTVNMINALLQEGILIDPSTKTYQSTLKINPRFDFYRLLLDTIYYKMEGVTKALEPLKGFERLIKDKKVKMDIKMDKKPDKFVLTVTPA